ncbi:MAG: hypothetical protein ACWGMZ_11780, partial [Thermoguttaceae bacterium]
EGEEYEYIKEQILHTRGLIEVLKEKQERIKERKAIAEAQRRKEEQVKEGARRLLETLESKVEIKGADHAVERWYSEWGPKQAVIGKMLAGLDFNAKRVLLEAIVGDERIKVMQGDEAYSIKLFDSMQHFPRSISLKKTLVSPSGANRYSHCSAAFRAVSFVCRLRLIDVNPYVNVTTSEMDAHESPTYNFWRVRLTKTAV